MLQFLSYGYGFLWSEKNDPLALDKSNFDQNLSLYHCIPCSIHSANLLPPYLDRWVQNEEGIVLCETLPGLVQEEMQWW